MRTPGTSGTEKSLFSVENATLASRVYKELLRGIVSGRLIPGSQVTIAELAEQLEVSLMPVRQALKALEAKNLVQIKKNRRLEIRKLSLPDLNEIFEIRLVLEQIAAREAAKRSRIDTIRRLERLIEEMGQAEDREDYLIKNQEFHHTLYRGADKPILFEIIEDLWFRVSPYMYLYLIRGNVHKHNPYHAGMLEGMRQRSPRQVCAWLKQDLEEAAEELKRQVLNRIE